MAKPRSWRALRGTSSRSRPTGSTPAASSELLLDGREALARGAAGLAADRLRAGLALWRGPALADVGEGGVLALEARRLDELRLTCLEERIEAELSLGQHDALVPELERLVAGEPLRERFWRQLVTALYRCDRQADALAAYRRARTLLSEELGLDPSEELQALERAVLRHELARPVPALDRHNLPARLSSIIGREQELTELHRLLSEHRLLTLTGVGGAGKTRLALEVAASQVGAWTGGVWLVDMSAHNQSGRSCRPRSLECSALPNVRTSPLLDGLLDHLRGEELLLVIDNCEHLASASGQLVHEVLRACSHVRVLATSRVVLGVPGEVDYRVEPLATPSDDVPADEVGRFASVRLFLERGRAARQSLAVGGAGAMTVARICRELDGLPLAIELAAARANVLSLEEIAARLDDRFRFLRSWRRLADPRHQTLRTTIDWSYDLLSEDERAVLAGLSVFAGGFSLAGVAAICVDGDDTRALERVRPTRRVLARGRGGHEGNDSLPAPGDDPRVRRPSDSTSQARPGSCAVFTPSTSSRSRREHGQTTCSSTPESKGGAWRFSTPSATTCTGRCSGPSPTRPTSLFRWRLQLRHYWLIRGHLRQGLEWLDQALARSPRDASPVRAAALAAAALLARLAGDFARAQSLAEEGIAVGRVSGSPRAVVTCLNVLTTLAGLADDYDRARAHCQDAVAIARSMGSARIEAIALSILAEAALNTRRYADVEEVGGRALGLSRAIDDQEGMALALSRLGIGAVHESRLDEAADKLAEALEYASTLGFPSIGAICCARARGRIRQLGRPGPGSPAPRSSGVAAASKRKLAPARRGRRARDGAQGNTPKHARRRGRHRARGRPSTQPRRGSRRGPRSVRIAFEVALRTRELTRLSPHDVRPVPTGRARESDATVL